MKRRLLLITLLALIALFLLTAYTPGGRAPTIPPTPTPGPRQVEQIKINPPLCQWPQGCGPVNPIP